MVLPLFEKSGAKTFIALVCAGGDVNFRQFPRELSVLKARYHPYTRAWRLASHFPNYENQPLRAWFSKIYCVLSVAIRFVQTIWLYTVPRCRDKRLRLPAINGFNTNSKPARHPRAKRRILRGDVCSWGKLGTPKTARVDVRGAETVRDCVEFGVNFR